MRTHFRRIAFPASLVVLMLLAAAPSYGSLTAPVATAPTNGGTFDTPPVFAWNPVLRGRPLRIPARRRLRLRVDLDRRHNQERARDGNRFVDERHLLLARPCGERHGDLPVGLVGDAIDRPQLVRRGDPQSPTNGASLTYPQPVLLNWAAVPYAQQYSVKLASDAGLSNLVSGFPLTTTATAFSPSSRLTTGTYYWSVTPLDALGHPGTPSPVYSFNWTWPTTSTLR